MAIVKMNKISLIGLENEKDAIVESLMKMGVVEINNIDQNLNDDEWAQLVTKDGDEAEVLHIDGEIVKVASALEHLSKYDTRKKGLFESKRTLSRNQYNEAIHNQDKVWTVVEQVSEYVERLSALKSEENRLSNLITTLEPWKPLTVPVEVTSTQNTVISLGVVPALVDVNTLQEELNEQVAESYLDIVSADKDQSYLFIIYHQAFEEEAMKVLKQYGFTRVTFKELRGTIEDNIRQSANHIKNLESERGEVEKTIAALIDRKQSIEVLHDYLMIQRDRKKALSNMVRTQKVFMLGGWLPQQAGEKVKTMIEREWDCVIQIQQPNKDEEYPIFLDNPSWVKPFELITELYSLPSSKGIDSNLIMAPFYFVFFGLMVSDAGYGLVMALATGILLAKYKLEGLAHKLFKLLFFGGISTFIWGALFGVGLEILQIL